METNGKMIASSLWWLMCEITSFNIQISQNDYMLFGYFDNKGQKLISDYDVKNFVLLYLRSKLEIKETNKVKLELQNIICHFFQLYDNILNPKTKYIQPHGYSQSCNLSTCNDAHQDTRWQQRNVTKKDRKYVCLYQCALRSCVFAQLVVNTFIS